MCRYDPGGTAGNQHGLTLIELVIALAISSVVMVAVYTAFATQTHDQISEESQLQMEQGLRTAMLIMKKEIREAGCNPMGIQPTNPQQPWTDPNYPQILVAGKSQLQFTMDITGPQGIGYPDGMIVNANGQIPYPREDVSYGLIENQAPITNGNSSGQSGPCFLGRRTCSSINPAVYSNWEVLCPNIDALNFVYLNANGNPIAFNSSGYIPDDQLSQICQVQITIVARSGRKMRGFLTSYTDSTTYKNPQGTVILPKPGDSYRRIEMTSTVTCRNL